jgi:hypothetical protein
MAALAVNAANNRLIASSQNGYWFLFLALPPKPSQKSASFAMRQGGAAR